ncbi:helix-turn-helix transcriptional regulator [Frankia sp. CNm7]|uniref:Helix-turn-helix transcriptional regulator n=1 Tax=Frankia nepalensis TaxID=1836974 RepID=A0A937RCM0_9ACTN|nr:helix-turn-helix domain-containing protein [Frankia nepalensis]MBL7499699.1 helix-turn-helix transcriptional regulator [Frankia nepalensis]MBL7513242.1 helix-turn-helix transcriptional regulator [Frankia nepalensis]MBL7517784.1 helix-turn-helix transcriptional regulator [Frankia nepalensis]MBL7626434.1 helix-turn-helix transcriptional regulator [Frankia nepalensis]
MTTQLDATTPRAGAGREKVVAAALELFAERGVSGTSLQMIADRLGVTKAAVYYHFKAKRDIVLAVVRPALAEIATIAEDAERERSQAVRTEVLLVGIVDLLIRHRRLYGIIESDLAVGEILATDPILASLGERLAAVLIGPDPDPGQIVAANMFLAGLKSAGASAAAGLTDDELRTHILDCGRRLLRRRRQPSGRTATP